MRTATIAAVALLAASVDGAGAQTAPNVKEIQGDPIYRSVAKDAIRSIESPRFAPATKAKFMRPDEAVIGVVLNGEARAYSIWHLDRHEIVNDRIGGAPISVTW